MPPADDNGGSISVAVLLMVLSLLTVITHKDVSLSCADNFYSMVSSRKIANYIRSSK